MSYYMKKLGHQELGSVGINGIPKRGRYIYISKDEQVLSFFPPLSNAVLNDSALLPIIPLYQKDGNKVYSNYIYHNDKYCIEKGTRDEFRIYCNKALESNRYLFKENDIIVFKRTKINLDGEEQLVYFLELVSDSQSELYKRCNDWIKGSTLRGAHAVVDEEIPEIDGKITNIIRKGQVEVVIDQEVTKKVQSQETDVMANLFNASTFRDFVMVGYENRCAITGNVIKYENFMNLEAAHIKPKSHGGNYLPSNGIALCRDLHWAFDKGFFTIDKELKVKVHPKTTSEYLWSFDGKSIHLPSNPFFIPNLENIDYHNQVVYGLFLTSGRL